MPEPAPSGESVAVLTRLVERERDAVYATENERTGCSDCNAMTAHYRHKRLADLDAAADWLAQFARSVREPE